MTGGCHCGALVLAVELSRPPEEIQPRACDCDFCTKHGAAWISDPAGSIRFTGQPARYRQGSGTAECLLCATCGVLVGVAYTEAGRVWATVNRRAIDGRFGDEIPVSPKTLATGDKIARWKSLWFADVRGLS